MDIGGIHDIDLDAQVGLNGLALDAAQLGITKSTPNLPFLTATFMAMDEAGAKGLHSVAFFPDAEILSGNEGQERGRNETSCAEGSLAGSHSLYWDTIESLTTARCCQNWESSKRSTCSIPLINTGQIVFWAKAGGSQAIVRAKPAADHIWSGDLLVREPSAERERVSAAKCLARRGRRDRDRQVLFL